MRLQKSVNICGANIEKIYDVGVGFIHRLTAYYEKIQEARAIAAVSNDVSFSSWRCC